MADAVARILSARGRILVEAGTGVGKSFAYLLPAALAAADRHERVVIATNTIALQEQIMNKDLPAIRAVLESALEPRSFRAALVKGRGNYLSIRRLKLASKRQDRLISDPAERRSLHVIEDWAYDTADGTLATLPPLERPAVWERAHSDAGNCMGRACPTYKACFFQRARREMEGADLLVCNHAILCSDLALRRRGVALLPEYKHVIIDEAHALEDVASDHFGVSLSEWRVQRLLTSLYEERRGRGLLASLGLAPEAEPVRRAIAATIAAGESARIFFDRVADLAQRGSSRDGAGLTRRLRDDDEIDNPLTPALRDLALHLKHLREDATREDDKFEIAAFVDRAATIADDAEALTDRALPGCAYWAEAKRQDRGVRATLACSPVEVAPALRETLFDGERSVVLTSATLTTAGGSFAHVAGRVGCVEPATLALGSPFDLARLVRLIVDTTIPEPGVPSFTGAIADAALAHIDETDGGAFVLFTSYVLLNRVADLLAPALAERGMPMWAQGRDGPRGEMLDGFRSAQRGVLLGAASFWMGVDVRGEALRNIIITRLPFDPPDRPIVEARSELIRSRGGDPFKADSLPRAVIRFKQGFGRLVRSATDRGRVVVLDPRIVTKPYGRAFLAALPAGVVDAMRVDRDSSRRAATVDDYPVE